MNGSPVIEVARGWTADLRRRAARERQPLSASLELTRRCNLACRHCYLGAHPGRPHPDERGAAAVCQAFDEWAKAGVLFLLITGGDPLMHPDFDEIYRHAKTLGFVVTVFCNGTLIDDAMVALFCTLPPRKVEISLYGATAATHDAVTRTPGSHARAWEGIRRLHARGIRVALKTMLLRLNRHELDAMEAQAGAMGVDFRYDAAVFPCLPGPLDADAVPRREPGSDDHDPLALRVRPEEVATIDTATPERRRIWEKAMEKSRRNPETGALYPCKAGASLFHADPYGNLSPCLMAAHYRVAVQGRSFQEVWRDDLGDIRHRQRAQPDPDFRGAARGVCTHCPAMNFMETGNEETVSAYMKQTAQCRLAALETVSKAEENL